MDAFAVDGGNPGFAELSLDLFRKLYGWSSSYSRRGHRRSIVRVQDQRMETEVEGLVCRAFSTRPGKIPRYKTPMTAMISARARLAGIRGALQGVRRSRKNMTMISRR